VKAQDLIGRHDPLLRGATRHPFLDGVREGTLPEGVFERWLVQDYLFVLAGLAFQSRLVPRAPRRDQALIIGGLAALETELSWFEKKARERGLALDASRHPTNAAYGEFLASLEDEPYPAAIAALWTLELAYLEAWRSAAPSYPEYREFVEHWTTPEFADYVSGLEQATDAALGAAPSEEKERAEAAFLKVARLERDFWEMAFSGGDT
jgi:formylaminopyrimidine deformylase / aminopyrimidine aminohydrolase